MAAGLPIIAVDAYGARDYLQHGRQGYLVENSADALANRIRKILANPKKMRQVGKSAYQKSRSFNIDLMTNKLLAAYDQAIYDKKKNRFVKIA